MGAKEDAAPEQQAAVRRAPLRLRVSAFETMLFAATVIIGAAAAPVPLPQLFLAFVVWLVGYLSLFIPPI